jgi:hypothetical protein
MDVSGRLRAPAALPSKKNQRCTLDRRLSWPQSQFDAVELRKISYLAGNRTQAAQPAARRYTDPEIKHYQIYREWKVTVIKQANEVHIHFDGGTSIFF